MIVIIGEKQSKHLFHPEFFSDYSGHTQHDCIHFSQKILASL